MNFGKVEKLRFVSIILQNQTKYAIYIKLMGFPRHLKIL